MFAITERRKFWLADEMEQIMKLFAEANYIFIINEVNIFLAENLWAAADPLEALQWWEPRVLDILFFS